MAIYDMERLSVLVVDDNQFARMLLSRVLRSLDVRQITLAADGAEAINHIKLVAKDPMKAGVQRFDLILADWVMSPVDGPMLLKWIRRHKDSPNRFIPFVMMSALSEQDKVHQARDMGANEFLAKPFSINSISKKLTMLIEKPRHYIYAPDYFGPDRRRMQAPIKGENRRTTTREEIEVIHNGKIPATFKDGIHAYYLRVPNKLKDIVAGIGGSGSEAGEFDSKDLEAAEMEIASMESDYSDWVRESIKILIANYEALKEMPKNYWKHFTRINTIAHDLRGQGDTFGYPLITLFGKSLFDYTKINNPPDMKFVELIKAHIDAIQVVLRQKIKGDGGEIGTGIVQTLDMAKKRYEAQR